MKFQQFTNKVVIVTGSAQGIGKNIARAFCSEGAHVVICDNNKKEGQKSVADFQRKSLSAEFLNADLRETGVAKRIINKVVSKWKKIDILVNNACSGKRLGMLEETEETWEEGISVALKAAFFLSQEAIRVMKRGGSGAIINISSVEGFLAGYDSPIYHIVKAGMIQMTRYFALHAGRFGIRVNCVAPGLIIKDEHKKRYEREDNASYRDRVAFVHPLGYPGSSDDVAGAVLFLAGNQAKFITGVCLPVDGGLTIQEPNGLIHRYNEILSGVAR